MSGLSNLSDAELADRIERTVIKWAFGGEEEVLFGEAASRLRSLPADIAKAEPVAWRGKIPLDGFAAGSFSWGYGDAASFPPDVEVEPLFATQASTQCWLPISTAPGEGEWCLLFVPGRAHGVVTGFKWLGAWRGSPILSDGLKPTHWQPLPAPPEVAA